MKYLLLIYTNEAEAAKMTKEEQEAEYTAYMEFGEHIRGRGIYVSGEALHPVSSATTVRVRDGKQIITDGPFAETKEQLGGFYLLDCKDLDDAIAAAARIPNATNGSIEIRPIVDFSAGG
jgi:hypothetical protein